MKLQELYGEECCAHDLIPLSFGEGGGEAIKLADPGDNEVSPTGGDLEGADSLLNGFLTRIHDGTLDKGSIDPEYYKYVADQLQSGVAKGLGGTQFGASDYRNTLKAYLDQNIYAFSSARSLYMLEQYRSFLTDAQGELLSESAFIDKVSRISDVDNITYLKTERASAIASAQMAEKWQGLQAFPALEYRTVEDDRVRPEHAILDNLVLATDDPRWSTIYPPNGWNCRCTVIPAAGDAELSPSDDVTNKVKAADIQPYFKCNVGEQQLVYADSHPYIQKVGVSKLKELDAEKNYGLPSGEKIYNGVTDLPKYKPLTDKATANAWWEDMAGELRKGFDLRSVDELQVMFDNDFRVHVMEDNRDDRYRFIKQLKDVLENPDEVWSNRVKGVIENIYIKYYEDFPIALAVEADKTVRAITFYEVQRGGKINFKALKNLRKGILKYKNR